MLASFKIKDSKVSLDGVDISGVGNTLEVLIHSELAETPGCRLAGKTSTLVKHKAFFRSGEVKELEKTCSVGKSYCFSREQMRYQMENVEISMSKFETIAGVTPVEIAVSGDEKPTCKRLMSLQRGI